MRKVLLTGSDGMLGTDVSELLATRDDIELIRTSINNLDITDRYAVKEKIHSIKPDVIIHTAAFTAVDLAEKEQDKCFSINVDGTKNIADYCESINAELIFISTDYVFDGTKKEPYIESDKRNPINIYGKSKSLAEEVIEHTVPRYKIVRTSWLNGLSLKYTGNFIEAILRKAKEQSEISVVNDQYGKPTFTFHLAKMLSRLLDINEYGIFHITNDGKCSWFEFAGEILKQNKVDGVKLKPIKSDEYPSLVKRPKNSVLENQHLKDIKVKLLPHWCEGLKEYFKLKEVKER